jgi:hypothetical protein
VWIVALLIAVVIGCAIGARPGYRYLKALRGLSANGRLQPLLDAGNWGEETERLLRLANKLAPNEPPVWRSTARFYTHFKNPQGLHYWHLYIQSGKAGLDDRLAYIGLAQTLNRVDLSRKELLELEILNPGSREAALLEVKQLVLEQQPGGAIFLCGRMLERYPEDSSVIAISGRIYCQSSDLLLRVKGQRLLRSLLKTNRVDQVEAALALALSEGAMNTDRRLALDLLRTLPSPSVAESLAAANLELMLEPERSREVFDAQMRCAADRPLAEQIEIGSWLLHRLQPQRVLEVLPLDNVRENSAGLQIRANALALLGQWSEFEKLTSESRLPWQQWQRSCNGAIVAWRQRRTEQVTYHLESALKETGGFTSAMELAKVAELVGQPVIAARALEKVLAFPPLAHEAATDILRLVAPLNDADLPLEALRTLVRIHPEDSLVRHEYIYVRLLRGERIGDEDRAFLQERAEKEPAQPVWRATWAFAELKAGRAEKAWDVFEQCEVDWTKSSPRCRLIQSLVLAANNSREASTRVWRTVNVSMLKRQEQSLAESLIQ